MASIIYCTGFGYRTLAGATLGATALKLWDQSNGAPAIVTDNPRWTGGSSLEISTASAVAESVGLGSGGVLGTADHLVVSFWVYVPSLPSADVNFVEFQRAATPHYAIGYRNSDGAIVVRIAGGGSEAVGPDITAATWVHVDAHVDISGATNTIDWRVNGEAQPQFSNSATATTFNAHHLGWAVTTDTQNIRITDFVLSKTAADYPLGPHKVVLLTVDPSGTVTASDGGTDFRRVTANGTIDGSWNAANVRDAVIEVPPTIGATASGAVQITLDTANYMAFPMTSYTLQSGESVAGARLVCPGWAASTQAATLGFRSYNGTTERTLIAATDPQFDNATVNPAWACAMLTLADIDTQAELDALEIRIGFSGDATPDVGVHAVYVEVAIREVQPTELTLTSAAATLDAQALTPVPQPVTVTLVPAEATLTAVTVTVSAGGGTVELAPAAATLDAVAVTPVPQPVEATLAPATLTLGALILTPVSQPVTVVLAPAVATLDPVPVVPVPQPVVLTLTPATAALTALPLTPVPQPVTVALSAALGEFTAQPLTPVPQPVTVSLAPALMTLTGAALGAGNTVTLAPATATLTAVPTVAVPQPVTLTLAPATAAVAAIALTVESPTGVTLVPATTALTGLPVDPQPQPVTLTLAPAAIVLAAMALTAAAPYEPITADFGGALTGVGLDGATTQGAGLDGALTATGAVE